MKLTGAGVVCFLILVFAVAVIAGGPENVSLNYPKAKTVDQTNDYHGVKVADPYRWLEDTDSEDTREWVEAENKLTFGDPEQIPYLSAIRERLTKLWNFERFTAPEQRGGHYFFHNNGLQNQNVLLVADSVNGRATGIAGPQYAVGRWDRGTFGNFDHR